MFYDKFQRLCQVKGISCHKAALEIGLSNATPTNWKKRGLTPNGETLSQIASYFGVATDYFLNEKMPEDISSGIWNGERLARERTTRGYSVEYIADRVGISEVHYHCLESNDIAPSISVLAKLADCFHCSIDYLCGRVFQTSYQGSSRMESDLLAKFRQLDARGQASVLNTLKHEYEGIAGDALAPAPKEA